MATPIQPYLNFSVLFDYTPTSQTGAPLPNLVLTDTGNYPAGVPQLVVGNFTITQPDGLTRTNTDFITAPDVKWNGSALPAFTIPLRLDCNGQVQLGVYTISYSVQATGYANGFLTRTFQYVLTAPTPVITPNFDVFTPSLKAVDGTVYTKAGFTDTEARTFSGLIASSGQTVSTSGVTLDMAVGGSYYDSSYTFNLSTVITYTGNPLSYLSAKVPVSTSLTTTANTPPACSAMINQLTAFQNQVLAVGCSCGSDTESKELAQATALLNSINTNLANKTYTGLYAQILQFENLVTNNQYSYTNTGAAIAAYNYNCGSGGGGGGGSTVNSVTVSFTVGDPGYAISGQSSVVFPALATVGANAKTIVIFTKGGSAENPGKNYTFTPATGGITLLGGDVFNNLEQIYIFAIYNS